jgi:hypothetical protein
VLAAFFIAAMIAVIFTVELTARWWRESEWKRRRHNDSE